MHYVFATAWLALGAAWGAAFFHVGSTVGGVDLILRAGLLVPATMNILMAVLCFSAAACVLAGQRVPGMLTFTALLFTLIHLFNAFGLYLIAASNGRIFVNAPVLAVPFKLVSAIVPTNSVFTTMLGGNWVLLLLPAACLVYIILSWLPQTSR